jgi:hypothetical protein
MADLISESSGTAWEVTILFGNICYEIKSFADSAAVVFPFRCVTVTFLDKDFESLKYIDKV